LKLDNKKFELFKNVDFSEICITSGFAIDKHDSNKIFVKTSRAEGKKCPVCWKINAKACSRHE